MEEKGCLRCLVVKPLSEFNKGKGKFGRHGFCKPCHSAYDKELYLRDPSRKAGMRSRSAAIRKSNADFIREYLETHPCVDCGEPDPIVLEFDHVRGRKRHNVSDLARRAASLKTVQAEIGKCDVRCANCHRRATHFRRLNQGVGQSGRPPASGAGMLGVRVPPP